MKEVGNQALAPLSNPVHHPELSPRQRQSLRLYHAVPVISNIVTVVPAAPMRHITLLEGRLTQKKILLQVFRV